jgi:hypothetical protein
MGRSLVLLILWRILLLLLMPKPLQGFTIPSTRHGINKTLQSSLQSYPLPPSLSRASSCSPLLPTTLGLLLRGVLRHNQLRVCPGHHPIRHYSYEVELGLEIPMIDPQISKVSRDKGNHYRMLMVHSITKLSLNMWEPL